MLVPTKFVIDGTLDVKLWSREYRAHKFYAQFLQEYHPAHQQNKHSTCARPKLSTSNSYCIVSGSMFENLLSLTDCCDPLQEQREYRELTRTFPEENHINISSSSSSWLSFLKAISATTEPAWSSSSYSGSKSEATTAKSGPLPSFNPDLRVTLTLALFVKQSSFAIFLVPIS